MNLLATASEGCTHTQGIMSYGTERMFQPYSFKRPTVFRETFHQTMEVLYLSDIHVFSAGPLCCGLVKKFFKKWCTLLLGWSPSVIREQKETKCRSFSHPLARNVIAGMFLCVCRICFSTNVCQQLIKMIICF